MFYMRRGRHTYAHRDIVQIIRHPVKKGLNNICSCWNKHEPDKQHDNESHIHIVPGITAKTYTIISEYMRYKYNPDAPVNRKGL